MSEEDLEPWLAAGRVIASPSPGEDIVITGIAGCFPESNNIHEFRDNLANKCDMVTYDWRRWEANHPEIPKRAGKIWNVEKFDAGFFGIHQHQCDAVDPLCRIIMEKTFECILDAGINPKELENTFTGIYVGACASESEKYWFYENPELEASAITGCHRSMLAARVAYALKLQGPAFVLDTACSSSFFAFEHAYRAIREGRCERAIVAGANLCLHPYVTLQFARLGVLSLDGACKCFDDAANGYTRSEAMCAILLQKSKEAKRIYAHVIHSKVNSDGYKEQGITYPSGDTQKSLIGEVYEECQIHPNEICYMEAHGTGTKVGDPEELKAIDDIFLRNRDKPLLIGSVKSNIGHTEPTSGLCSISKVILSYEGGKILPNVNFKNPRRGIGALSNGQLKVITDNTPWPDEIGLVGINSFGFGGANCHTILRQNSKQKSISVNLTKDKLPILVCVSGRTSDSIKTLLEDLKQENQHQDPEYVRLLHEIFKYNIHDHNYRGYLLILGQSQTEESSWCPDITQQTLIYNFGDLQTNFESFSELLAIPLIKDHLWDGFDPNSYVNWQVLLVLVFRTLGIKPDVFHGKSSELFKSLLEGSVTIQNILETFKGQHQDIETTKHSVVLNFGTSIVGNPKIINIFEPPHNGVQTFFQTLGKMYIAGIDLSLYHLYPKIAFPVARGTSIISPLIKWDHHRDWYVTKYRPQDIIKTGFVYMALDLKDEFWKYLSGHIADGRNLFPATGYLSLVWDVLGMITGKITSSMRVVFEDVRFHRATNIPTKGTVFFTVMLQRGTGNFEVVEGGVAIVTGTIKELQENEELCEMQEPPSTEVTLNQKDIYTELKLRGYNYRGSFKALNNVTLSCSKGDIFWTGNWVTFLDNMLQMQILQSDTRSLYVPTGIKRIVIDAIGHSKQGEELSQIPVWAFKDLGMIRCRHIELRGIMANVINRRKLPEAVLEKYVFVPNQGTLNRKESLRVIVQVALENYPLTKLKIIEHVNHSGDVDQVLLHHLRDALDDLPLIESDLRIFTSKKNLDLTQKRIYVEDKFLGSEIDCYMLIFHHIDDRQLAKIKKCLKPQGFLVIHSENNKATEVLDGYNLLLQFDTSTGWVTLYQRQKPEQNHIFLKYENGQESDLLSKVQKVDPRSTMVLFSENAINGILGFTNCLKKEPSVGDIKCIISDIPINPTDSFIKEQISKQMCVNILKDNKWGTFRHLTLNSTRLLEVDHAYVNVTTRGDLSSLSWIHGPLTNSSENLIKVHYGAVNFRDVMTASGRVSVDAITNDRREQECVQGFEYSGIDSSGRRVMGMLASGAMSTVVIPDSDMLLPVPEHWSLEDAATVPAVYGTVLFGFFIRAGGLTPGQSVLIHSGTGGVGQAAIAIATFFKCQVFATVGSEEKKTYLLKKFPKFEPLNIGCSRDTTFETLVMNRTQGRGVDIVLNSLSEEKLQASLRCLAENGHYLEIGKFDLSIDSPVDVAILQKGITYHGIMLDGLFKTLPSTKQFLINSLQKIIDMGAVVPLDRTVFERDELEKAFRFMSTGKHVGKVVIKVRDSPQDLGSVNDQFLAIPRYYCPTEKSCLVIGGLGGFGLELCDWLVLRGCMNLFITSRNGPRTGYQHLRLRTWKSYGCTVTILTENLLSDDSCKRVLERAKHLDAIFNLAVVLHDGLLENQTKDHLGEVLRSKYQTTKLLDQYSRTLCSDLKHFVVFSSVVCGRGNIGQVNYGMANSLMEKLMENRQVQGYPALAVQWGSIADVGLAAELINDDLNERPIGGTLPQRISNCLEVLDQFMNQSETIVASMVVADKRGGFMLADNMVDTVVNILGIRDLKTISLHSTLPEIGMDSMMAVEIKQTLERDYEVFLTAHDIRTLTFARLQGLQDDKAPKSLEQSSESHKDIKLKNHKLLLRFINDEECSKQATIPIRSALNEVFDKNTPKVFLIPGVEGFGSILENLCLKLHAETIALQFVYDDPPDTLQDMANLLVPYVVPYLTNSNSFHLVAYSFGCTVALELAAILETSFGFYGQVFLIDGAQDMMLKITHQQTNTSTPSAFETSILCNIFSIYMPLEIIDLYKEELLQMETYEERVNFVQSKSPKAQYSKEYIKKVCIAIHKRVRAVLMYKKGDYLLKSDLILLKPTRQSVVDIEEDYNLKTYSAKGCVKVKTFDADHYTILENEDVAQEIDKLILGNKTLQTGKDDNREVFIPKTKTKIR